MDLQEEKLSIIERLIRVQDSKIIEQVKEVLKKEENPVVGYKADGSAITQKEFIQQVEEAEGEYKSGRYQTIEDLKKESESW